MPQSAERVLDHADLFREPEYQELLKNKRDNFECPAAPADVEAQNEYTKGWEYREKNLAREALVINPVKACQPLGAVFAAAGFEGTLSFVHGSQGCVAYYRSHLARHFKEPASAVSSSMTEDAAVFGGLNNMVDGLANAHALYAPKMIAVSTTCMGSDRRRPARVHRDIEAEGVGPAGLPCTVRPYPGLRRQPRHRLRQRHEGHHRALLGRQGRHRAEA